MSLKMILAAALALVMVSCGGSGGGGTAAQKKSASASFRAISALGPSIFGSVGSLLSKNPRLQDTDIVDLTCDGGGAGTIAVTSTDNSFALVLKAPAGCTSSGTTIKTSAAGLSMTFTGSGDFETTFSFTLAINGSATITTGSSTEAFTYSNFSVKLDAKNTGTAENPVVTATVTINGSVTSTADGTQTFNNVVYNSNDLN